MHGSLIDMLPPEAQNILGFLALGAGVLGLILWGAGIKIARVLVAILVGGALAALGAWALPHFLGSTTLTGAIAGFALGLILGATAFRLLQGLTLAACLGLAVAGGYYVWHVEKFPPPPVTTHHNSGEVRASDLLIQNRLAPTATTTSTATAPNSPYAILSNYMEIMSNKSATAPATNSANTFLDSAMEHWNAIDPVDRHRMLAAGLGTAAVVLLLAFGFPRHTTLVVSAILGALLLVAAAEAAGHLYAPALERFLNEPPLKRYLILAILAALGVLLQWALFWRPRKPRAAILREEDDTKNAMGRPKS